MDHALQPSDQTSLDIHRWQIGCDWEVEHLAEHLSLHMRNLPGAVCVLGLDQGTSCRVATPLGITFDQRNETVLVEFAMLWTQSPTGRCLTLEGRS